MTTLATREQQASEIEKVTIIFKNKDGSRADQAVSGLPRYPYEKALKGSHTVSDLKANRLKKTYPNFEFDILKDDGIIADGQTNLSSVRQTYEED